MTAPSFTCPLCGTTTFREEDVAERYCPECHAFVDDLRDASVAHDRGDLSDAELARLTAGTGFSVPRVKRALRGDGHAGGP